MKPLPVPPVVVVVNSLLVATLAFVALVLLIWQPDALHIQAVPTPRLVVALLALTAWLAVVARAWRVAHRCAMPQLVHAADGGKAPLLVAHASQTGYAEQLAWQTASALDAAGVAVRVAPLHTLDADALLGARRVLLIASTTGEGDAPDVAAGFVHKVMRSPSSLHGLRYGLLALGDRNYAHYCGFGRELRAWLDRRDAVALFDPIEVDNGDADALRRWQWQLGVLSGASEMPDWQTPSYRRWKLVERRLLNADCTGNPCYHLALRAIDPADGDWQAGDIAEIGPRHAAVDVDALLHALHLDGRSEVVTERGREALADALARSHLPDAAKIAGIDAQALAASLQALPHREYSIASLPVDGALHLLLRQMRRPNGSLGLGSGWLTAHAPIGAEIDLRIRRNENFRPPPDGRPLILIGNGTGIAGLRALLKARIAAGHRDNWLLFGERHAEHDHYYRDDIDRWLADGGLRHVDLAFSRDSPRRMYVQEALRASAPRLRTWVADGAAVYVCGSQQGMAQGVHDALVDLLGRDMLETLTTEGRYRRDVY